VKERSIILSQHIQPGDNTRIEIIDTIKSVHSDLTTHELVLPRAVSKEKFDFISDAYSEGAFNKLAPDRREVVLVYFTSEHTTGNIPGYTKGVAQNHILSGVKEVWSHSSPEIKEKYSFSLATSLKDRYDQRRGRPLNDAQNNALRLALESRKNNKEYRNKISATLKLKVTPQMRQKSRDAALKYRISEREKIAETDPARAQELERRALKRIRKKLLLAFINFRSQNYPDYDPPKAKIKILKTEKSPRPSSKTKDKKSVKTMITVKPSKFQEPDKLTPSKKPDLKIEDRLENPFEGAKRNLRFLQEELPLEIVHGFKARPHLLVEWKTLHAIINSFPYFRYENGYLNYVVPGPDESENKYVVTEDLLNSLWNGGNVYFQLERDNINKFGRISIEELGTALKYALLSA
jgi:hypothetical protein